MTDYQKLIFHSDMIKRLKKLLLDCLIVTCLGLLLLVGNIDNRMWTIVFGSVSTLFGVIAMIIGYGIHRGKDKFDKIANSLEQKTEGY